MIKELAEELRKDQSPGSYYDSWKANIAMAFLDEMDKELYNLNSNLREEFQEELDIHSISNNAAEKFLKTLIK